MNTVVSLPIIAAVPTTAPVMVPTVEHVLDPIFAAIETANRTFAELVADESGSDEFARRSRAAFDALVRTRPTTPAGLTALTTWAREEANAMLGNSHWSGETLSALTATIDDAARGMSGLEPWSPPTVVAEVLGQHPDAELFAAIDRFYAAMREYDVRLRAFSKVEFIEPRPRGYVSKEREYLRSMNRHGKIEREVAAIRARTMDGLIAKAAAANNEFCESEEIRSSVADDALTMAPSSAIVPTAPPSTVEDEKLVALGEKFEPLLDRYYAAHRSWSYDGGKDPGGSVWPKLAALAKAIYELPASSPAGLRVKALVAFWEVSPLCKGDTEYSFDDAHPFQVLFSAVADYCGLAGRVASTGYKLPAICASYGGDEDEA